MSQLPARVNLDAYHGDTWAQTFRLKQGTTPVDLTGATVASWASDGATTTPLTATITNPTGGEITISATAPGLPTGAYSYDVEITVAGQVTTWIRGQLTIAQDITNAA